MIWQEAMAVARQLLKAMQELTAELRKVNARYESGKELDT